MFEPSSRSRELLQKIRTFIKEYVEPMQAQAEKHYTDNPWQPFEPLVNLKAEAKKKGLWNLFLADREFGSGLSNLEYAPLAEVMGPYGLAQEAFNCSAPDTGNMEVLIKYGTDEQQKQWLYPLLAGEIRSCFAMTEPSVASSDATNMAATIEVDNDELVLNGRKWYITGYAHPNTKICLFMGLSDQQAQRHLRHSIVLVPTDLPGVKLERHMTVFGRTDADHGGHAEITFTDVRVPKENVILGLGRGFEIAQGRLGPGRIHHCMRSIGIAEYALKMMIERGLSRTAFGKPLIHLHGNRQLVAQSRLEIEQARLLTLKAASLMDQYPVQKVMSEISQIKVVVPRVTQEILDRSIQMHGACGVSDDTNLAKLWAHNRTLRLADGPDDVHLALIARSELKNYLET